MELKPEPQLISQTPQWWVVDKPAHWLSVPGRSEKPVVLEWLRKKYGEAWVVHRLDEETSGVMLFARSEAAHRLACQWFTEHSVRKVYEFLAQGSPRLPVFKVNQAIEEKPSSTQIEVQERFALSAGAAPEYFAGRARPLTGRRHQIRIHLSGSGFPICGDRKYGGALSLAPGVEVARVALHASSLGLPSGEVFESALPKDFSQWVSQIRALGGTVQP
ncbi:MAG: RluA family pseudouridine synthase [Bdellovibrionales bacterium]|nr:RluA family pseudouridine synthase [Bdellovibrionales bacterium]